MNVFSIDQLLGEILEIFVLKKYQNKVKNCGLAPIDISVLQK